MRTTWLFLVVLAVTPALALAGVSGTLHDRDALASGKGGYGGSPPASTGGTCSYCHVPHKAVGVRLFPVAGISGAEAWLDNTTGINKVTPRLCNTCHNSSSFDSDITGNAGMYLRPYQSTSHMDNPTTLGTYGESLVANARVDNTGKLECTSCHDVHSNAKRPFLQTYGAAGDISKNCEGCHGSRANDANGMRASNAAGNHPTSADPGAPANATNRFVAAIDNAFKVAQNPNEDGSAVTSGAAFKIGGHLNAGGTGTVRCYTCHAVHGTNAAAPSDGLLVKNNTSQPTAALCEGCHYPTNPGADTTSTHPVNTLESAWKVDVTGKPGGWPWGSSGGTNTIICSSCHDMHYSSPTTSNLRRNGTTINASATPYTSAITFCNACHGGSTWDEAVNGKHHPIGNYGAVGSGTNYRANPSVGTTTWSSKSWSSSSDLYPFDNDAITCATCHSKVTGSTYKSAHNLSSWPQLTGTDNASQMCIDCHSFNPSTYLVTARGVAATSLMSHYVGPIVTGGYKRTAAFGVSKVDQMKYPNIGGSDYIVCESCHTLKKDTNLGTGAKKSFSWNDNTTPASINVKATPISLMVEKSGNAVTYSNAADYLCTGCHGASPGGNTTHPTMPTSSTSALSGVTTQLAAQETASDSGQATLPSSNNAVNCDSCHRAHNASGGTGALILESQNAYSGSVKPLFALASDNSYADQEGLCKRCHNR